MRIAQARRHNGVPVAALRGGGPKRVVLLAVLLTTLSAAACTGGAAESGEGPGGPHRRADLTATAADWTTFGRDALRTATVHGRELPASFSGGQITSVPLDGAVYGQPLVVGDTVLAATENDSVFAVSARDGSVVWRAHLDDPYHPRDCGNIQPSGITGTPVYDPGSRRLFVVTEDPAAAHTLVTLDAATGAVLRRVPLDAALGPAADPAHLQQRPALALMDGRVYIAFGGLFGDCGDYTGAIVSADAAAATAAAAGVQGFQTSRSGKGGVWAPGGPPRTGRSLLYSVGNGNVVTPGSAWDGSDSVIAVGPLPGTGVVGRTGSFTPADWAADNRGDLDLGSMNPAVVNGRVVIAGKAGRGYTPGVGLGGPLPPAFGGCAGFGAAAVDGDVAYLPCATGIAAVRVATDGAATVLWRAPVPANGSPTVAGGRVWAADYAAGILYALDPATGTVAGRTPTAALPHFAAPSAAGNRLFLGTAAGLQIFSGS